MVQKQTVRVAEQFEIVPVLTFFRLFQLWFFSTFPNPFFYS